MYQVSRPVLAFLGIFAFSVVAQSATIPNTDAPTTFLGPTARLGITNLLSDTMAYSLAGEAGVKNFRLGATLGFKQSDYQRFKVSGEWLTQDITYAFFSGNEDQWVNQGAIGAAYQYDLPYQYSPQFDLSGYYSHAPSKNLNTINSSYINAAGNPILFTEARRIAGSKAFGIMPSLSIAPWQGGRVSAGLNYDDVDYDKYTLPNENAVGFGGTAGFTQILRDGIELGVEAELRQPFNNYSANVSWVNPYYFKKWSFKLFGDYTDGKHTLPNTYNIGLGAYYIFDKQNTAPTSMKDKDGLIIPTQGFSDRILGWTAKPAVYMPQVLAIADSRVTPVAPACTGTVTYTGPANIDNLLSGNSFVVNYAPLFAGDAPITYSEVTTVSNGTGNPSDCSINSSTGVLTCTNIGNGFYLVTVTATNACGSASKAATYADQ